MKNAVFVERGIPAYVLRAAIVVVGAAIVFVPLHAGVLVGTLVILVPAVVASAYAPASPAPAGVVVAAAVLITLDGGDPLRPAVLVLIPLVHLFHVVCGLAGVMPASGRLHAAALWVAGRRFLLVQAAMAVVVVIAAVLPTGRTAQLFEGVALVGLAGVAVLVIRLQRVK
jgi:hypothetical protein